MNIWRVKEIHGWVTDENKKARLVDFPPPGRYNDNNYPGTQGAGECKYACLIQ